MDHPLNERLRSQQRQHRQHVAPRPLTDVEPCSDGEDARGQRGPRREVPPELTPARPETRQAGPGSCERPMVGGGNGIRAHGITLTGSRGLRAGESRPGVAGIADAHVCPHAAGRGLKLVIKAMLRTLGDI